MDLRWMSAGGILLDGTGDIAVTQTAREELESMVLSRIQVAVDGWKLYQIGAGLDDFIGEPVETNTELSIQRAVTSALTKQFLASGTFTVQTVPIGNTIEVYVYLDKTLIASTSVTV